MADCGPRTQGGLRALLRNDLRRRRPFVRRLSFCIHGVDLRVTTDRPEAADAIQSMLAHAAISRPPRRNALTCYVYAEPGNRPGVLDRFTDARMVMRWETTGYFAWRDLCLIDFYPWGTSLVDAKRGVAALILNSHETPPPLIFSNQVFFQTLEALLHARGLYPIHASAVARGRRAVLFPAESGAGKTTLALTLVRASFRYLGDDKPLIVSRAGRPTVLAFPEPIHAYVDELRAFENLPHRPHPDFPPDYPLKQSFRIEDRWPGSVLNSARPRALVFPEPREETPPETRIEPISRVDGLRRLIEQNWPVQLPWHFDGFLDAMRDLAEQTPCYRLRFGATLDDLPERIAALV